MVKYSGLVLATALFYIGLTMAVPEPKNLLNIEVESLDLKESESSSSVNPSFYKRSMPEGVVGMSLLGQRSSTHPNQAIEHRINNLIATRKSDDEQLLGKREFQAGSFLGVNLDNDYTFYSINLTVGTPAQAFNLLIDTGSSDLWVLARNNPYCSDGSQANNRSTGISPADQFPCDPSGMFTIADSSTWTFNNSDFEISYLDSTSASGDWGTDVVKIEEANLNGVSLAVGIVSNSSMGVLGIGFEGLESTFNGSNSSLYYNLPQELFRQKYTESVAYSLYLNNINSNVGHILFGGVDHNNYNGSLTTVPLINRYADIFSTPIEFTITLSGISLQDGNNHYDIFNTTSLALLDSGTSISYLPVQAIQRLVKAFGAQYSSSVGLYVMPCTSEQDIWLNFNFTGAVIQVPLTELLTPLQNSKGAFLRLSNGEYACAVGLSSVDDVSDVILGDTFLRSAYVVYDLANFEISLAQANFFANSNNANIEAIKSSVPSATSASQVNATFVVSTAAETSTIGILPGSATRHITTSTESAFTVVLSISPLATNAFSTSTNAFFPGTSATTTSTTTHKSMANNVQLPVALTYISVVMCLLAVFI